MVPGHPGVTVDALPQAVGLSGASSQVERLAPFVAESRWEEISDEARELDLFVDHSQIVQLECLRRGSWGTKSLWGRVVTYPGGERG
jgi:hypothetical protein